MNNKKTQNITKISFSFIITAYIFIFSAAFAQTQPQTDPNEEMIVLNKNTVVQKIFKFKYNSLSQMAQIIEPLLSDEGYLDGDEGLLKVTDKVSVLLNLENIINKYDVATEPDIRQQIFVVHNRDPYEIVKLVQIIVKNKSGTGSTSKPEEEPIVLIPVPEKNWIIARASAKNMKTIEEWITKFDSGYSFDKLVDISLSEIKDKNQLIKKFFYLKYSSPENMEQILKPLLSKNGYLKAEENARTLLIVETVENLTRLEMIIKSFDAGHPSNNGQILTVKYIDPNKAAEVITKVIELKIFHLSEETVIVPVPEKNWLIVLNEETPEEVKFIMDLLESIDFQKNPESANDIKAIKLTNRNPVHLLHIIKPLLGINGHVNANEQTQTLEISDTADNLTHIENLIKILDISGIPNEDPMVSISLSSIDINKITQMIEDWTGKKVLPSKEAQNLIIMVYTPEKMRRSEALNLLYYAMRENGFIAVITDNIIDIKPYSYDPGPQIPLLGPNEPLEKIPDKDMIVRKIFKLNYCSPSELGKILLPLLTSHGYITAVESNKTMMITDSVGTLIRIEQIIKQLDSKNSTGSSKLVEINIKDPNEIIQLINKILKQQADSNSSSSVTNSGRTGRDTKKQTDENSIKTNKAAKEDERQKYETIQVRYIDADQAAIKLNEILFEMGFDVKSRLIVLPLAPSKQILVFGNNENDRKLAESLIHDFDLQASDKSYDFERIPLKYVDSVEVADSLNTLLKEINRDIYRNVSIYPIVPSNQLLVFGKKMYRDMVKELVEEVDLPANQVQKVSFQLKYIDPEEIKSKPIFLGQD